VISDWQLQQLAIKVCERRGVNPYEMVAAPPVPGCDVYLTVHRWMLVTEEVTNYIALREVVDRELGL